jgi:hypothetical protein
MTSMGVGVCPVGEDEHLLAVGLDRLAAAWLDDDAAIHAALLLEMCVRVKPVGAAVPQRELKSVGGAGLDRRCGDMRHAVFFVRQQQAVPVRGGFLALRSL